VPTEQWNHISFTWLYENDAELFVLQCLVDKYENYPKVLIMPYAPHARMDRVKNASDVFTLKTFCKMINAMEFMQVAILDPHSDVTPALLNNVAIIDPTSWMQEVIENKHVADFPDEVVYFYPDAGAAKRYATDAPHTYGVKKRNWETGKIESLVIAEPEMVAGKNVVIVDDICSYGGTFSRAAAALKEAGAEKIYLFVTHCEDNIFKGTVFSDGNIDAVITTNSLIHTNMIQPEYSGKIFVAQLF
jgi:ribose-phosphate pyrophosphokinase